MYLWRNPGRRRPAATRLAGTTPSVTTPAVTRAGYALLGLILGLLALGPALRRGFLLSYDMVFVPREAFAAALSVGGPPRAVPSDLAVAVASRVLPADIVQKLVLLAIFMLACAGAITLLDREPPVARLTAGVYYAWNPYLAERLIIGQWALLLGYAGLPWALRAVLRPDLASWRGSIRLALALLPAVIGGFAAMAITALVVVPVALCSRNARHAAAMPVARNARYAAAMPVARNARYAAVAPVARNARHAAAMPVALGSRNVRHAAVALAALAVGSLPWLIPSVLHPVYADPAGVAAFASRADTPFGTVGSLLMLGGAWNAQTAPKAYGGPWSALWLAVVLTAIVGYAATVRRAAAVGPGKHGAAVGPRERGAAAVASPRSRWPGLGARSRWPGLSAAAVAGLLIASIGITAAGRDLLVNATRVWPGFAVLRDGQQFVAPLALVEALGLGLAVSWAKQAGSFGIKKEEQPVMDRTGLALGIIAVLAPVLLLPGLVAGAAGRLRPAWYPPGWLAAARAIDADPIRGDVLLLPWASYRTPSWNHGEVILDPWPRLLSRPVIWNDGTRVGNVTMAPDDPRARRLDGIINSARPLTAALRAEGVRFVVVDAGPPGSVDAGPPGSVDAGPPGSVDAGPPGSVDAGPPGSTATDRLPGCPVMISQPGLVVYRIPS